MNKGNEFHGRSHKGEKITIFYVSRSGVEKNVSLWNRCGCSSKWKKCESCTIHPGVVMGNRMSLTAAKKGNAVAIWSCCGKAVVDISKIRDHNGTNIYVEFIETKSCQPVKHLANMGECRTIENISSSFSGTQGIGDGKHVSGKPFSKGDSTFNGSSFTRTNFRGPGSSHHDHQEKYIVRNFAPDETEKRKKKELSEKKCHTAFGGRCLSDHPARPLLLGGGNVGGVKTGEKVGKGKKRSEKKRNAAEKDQPCRKPENEKTVELSHFTQECRSDQNGIHRSHNVRKSCDRGSTDSLDSLSELESGEGSDERSVISQCSSHDDDESKKKFHPGLPIWTPDIQPSFHRWRWSCCYGKAPVIDKIACYEIFERCSFDGCYSDLPDRTVRESAALLLPISGDDRFNVQIDFDETNLSGEKLSKQLEGNFFFSPEGYVFQRVLIKSQSTFRHPDLVPCVVLTTDAGLVKSIVKEMYKNIKWKSK